MSTFTGRLREVLGIRPNEQTVYQAAAAVHAGIVGLHEALVSSPGDPAWVATVQHGFDRLLPAIDGLEALVRRTPVIDPVLGEVHQHRSASGIAVREAAALWAAGEFASAGEAFKVGTSEWNAMNDEVDRLTKAGLLRA